MMDASHPTTTVTNRRSYKLTRRLAGLRVPRTLLVSGWAGPSLVIAVAIVAFVLIVPSNASFFRPATILHGDETGFLVMSRHLADTGSFVVDDPWYAEQASHVPNGGVVIDGKLVPKKAVGGYFVYAAAFLISDSAWLKVGPFFGLVAAGAAGLLVYQKTRNYQAAAAAAIVLGTSSPFIIYASGLAFSDIISLAAMLCGTAALLAFVNRPSPVLAFVVGLAFGLAVLVRYDFVIAGGLAAVAGLGFTYQRHRRAAFLAAAPGVAAYALCILALLVANNSFYGSPFSTGYVGGWQESPSGVAGSVNEVSWSGLNELFVSYMIRIGLPLTVLLAAGVAIKIAFRKFDAADIVLLGFAGFAIVYYLGRPGAYGTGETWLVSSYPRYVLAAYAAGAIVGLEGIVLLLQRLRPTRHMATAVLLAVALVVAGVSIREAFTNERGPDYIDEITAKHELFQAIANEVPDPVVVVSDLNSKAIIDLRIQTIRPRRSRDVSQDVIQQLSAGKNVVVFGDNRGHPGYSGYVETLQNDGVCLETMAVPREAYRASSLPGPSRLFCEADDACVLCESEAGSAQPVPSRLFCEANGVIVLCESEANTTPP